MEARLTASDYAFVVGYIAFAMGMALLWLVGLPKASPNISLPVVSCLGGLLERTW